MVIRANDIESTEVSQIHKEIKLLVEMIKQKLPQYDTVLSEILDRAKLYEHEYTMPTTYVEETF